MTRPTFRHAFVALAALLPLLGTGCSSPPSRLYLLNSTGSPAAPSAAMSAASGTSQPPRTGARAKGALVGVAVTVPEYLDRLDIVERTSANELKPNYAAQWGEPLGVTATRVVAEDLMALLPTDDIIILPSRIPREFAYQVNLELTRFESDAQGNAVLFGRWSVLDRDGAEKASGRVQRSEQAEGAGYDAMAAAMSRNLAVVSAEIATALKGLPAGAVASASAPRPRPSTQKPPAVSAGRAKAGQ